MMTLDETMDLLSCAACFDQRTVGQTDVRAWHAVAELEGWTFALANRAVIDHFRESRDRLMPADVTQRIRQARRRIREAWVMPQHSPELADDGPRFITWAREQVARHMAAGLAEWADTGRLPKPLPELEA